MNPSKQQWGLQPTGDELAYAEARVVNITDEEVRFTIATTPGANPRVYRLAPFGHEYSAVHLPTGYTRPYEGAGRKMIRPIIETRTMREVYPAVRDAGGAVVVAAGPQLPMVVHEEFADQARAAWQKAFYDRDHAPKPVTVQMHVPASAIERMSTPPRAAAKPALRGEVVDQAADAVDQDAAPDDEPVVASGPPASSSSPATASSSAPAKPGKARS